MMKTTFIGVAFESWNTEAQEFTDYVEALNWYNRQDNDRPKYLCTVIQTNQTTESEDTVNFDEEYMTMTLQEFTERFGFLEDNWYIIGLPSLRDSHCYKYNPETIIEINWDKAKKLRIYEAEFSARKIKN